MRSVTRLWATLLVALFPPGFRADVGGDLGRLLADRGLEASRRGAWAWVWFVAYNSVRCALDAAGEWWDATAWVLRDGGGGNMESVLGWIRLAARGAVRRPSYSVPVVLTLALGIGANTAMFSVLYGVVIQPLPYPGGDSLVRVYSADASRVEVSPAFSLPDFRDWQDGSQRLAALGAYTTLPSDLVLTGGEDATEAETAYVTTGFFEALATSPLLGRFPTVEEEQGDNRVVLLSHALWQQRFAGDPARVGATIEVNGEPYRVLGVMPPDFAYPDAGVEVWALLSVIPPQSIPFQYRGVRLLNVVGRLAPGTSLQEGQEDLSTIAASLAEAFPDTDGERPAAALRPLREIMVGDVSRALALLMAAAVVILLVVCANVANLALAREARRKGDLAVRAALGAGRGGLMAVVVAESLLLSLAGGAAGLLLATWGTAALSAAGADLLPRSAEIGLSWPVAIFTLVASLITGVVFSLIPGLRAGRTRVADSGLAGTLRSAGRSVTGPARGALVASQVALAIVLVVGAGLLVRSLQALGQVDSGFRPEGLVVADMTFPSSSYPGRAEYLARFDETMEALAALPGVTAVGAIRHFPFLGEGESVEWSVPGRPVTTPERDEAQLLQVDGRAFEALGARVVAGTDLAEGAGEDGRLVAVVNEALAVRSFGGQQVVGRTLTLGGQDVTVVGVVADIRQDRLDQEAAPTVYVPNRMSPRRGASFLLRVRGDESTVLTGVRSVVRGQDPDQAITVLAPATQLLGGQLSRPRLFATLLGLLAALALTLSAVGVYGVVAFGVAERRREIGIRLALGATAGEVLRLVIRQGMVPVLLGAGAGVATAAVLVRSLSTLLYGVGERDPVSFTVAVAILVAVGLLACWLPGRTAGRTPPTVALTADA